MATSQLDLASIEAALIRDGVEPVGDLSWLAESYLDPEAFWTRLMRAQEPLFPWRAKSVPFGKYDFFHDIIARNRHNEAPALRWYESVGGWGELSYGRLGELAAARADVWSRTGVCPGHRVCIVGNMGSFVAVSVLAALKLGAELTLLPPQGDDFVRRRLTNLAPEWIAAEWLNQEKLDAWKELLLPDIEVMGPNSPDVDRSWSYPSGATVVRCFDPSSRTPDMPCEVDGDATYLCPLRDGFLSLGLRPGHAFAAPGSHFLETQPAALLACLLNGATYVHVPVEELEKHPGLLVERPVGAVQVSLRVAEILLKAPCDAGSAWSAWYRNPAESRDLEFWREWTGALNLGKTGAGNLLWRAAHGGSILFSCKRIGTAHMNVLPSPGVPWQMASLEDSSARSLWNHGVMALAGPRAGKEEFVATAVVLARNRNEWLFAGTLVSGRAGRVYPKAEVLEILGRTPFARRVCLVEIPAAGVDADPAFALAVFTAGLEQVSKARVTSLLGTSITRAMGREFMPDHITIFPLYPRKGEKEAPDDVWCNDQYLRGWLFRKARDPLYVNISRLRSCLWQAR